MTVLAFLLVLTSARVLRADSVNTSKRTVTKLADGVYEIRHPDAPDTLDRKSVV
jgi:hypothetical protein